MTHIEQIPTQNYKREKKDNEMITICFCVSLSRGPLRGLPDSAWMMRGSENVKK